MNNYKKEILKSICYTELVYERINKKLNLQLSRDEIEEFVLSIIKETEDVEFTKIGKNIYIASADRNIRLTINSNTNRIITTDRLSANPLSP